jgi:hypothetical protein
MMHIFEKTGIRDRFELAMYGLKLADTVHTEVVEPVSRLATVP